MYLMYFNILRPLKFANMKAITLTSHFYTFFNHKQVQLSERKRNFGSFGLVHVYLKFIMYCIDICKVMFTFPDKKL